MSAGVAGGVRDLAARTGIVRLLPAITEYVAAQRWSGGRGGGVADVEFVDAATLFEGDCTVVFTVIRTRVGGGREARFALPVGLRPVGDPLAERAPAFMIGEAEIDGRQLFAYDAVGDPAYIHWVWSAMRESRSVSTEAAELRFTALDPVLFHGTAPDVRWLGTEQSNTSMVLGDTVFLKHLRRIEEGPSHELEMAQALDSAGFPHLATLIGTALYAPADAAPCLLALAQPYLHNATEGWALALTSLRDLYANAEEAHIQDALQRHHAVDEQGGAFTAEAARLGAVVAQMHRALASRSLPPEVAPEPLTRERMASWAATMSGELDTLLQRSDPLLAPVRAARDKVNAHFAALRTVAGGGLCTLVHGDLHLGQVMRTDSGWFILDFEGEPNRSPGERRERSSPLRDVAAMLRSFDYAAAAALAERADPPGPDAEQLKALGEAWAQINRDAFWAAYLSEMVGAETLASPGASLTLRRAFEVQKAVYEVDYELGHRPSWAHIPLGFLLRGAA
jgi:maltokinase